MKVERSEWELAKQIKVEQSEWKSSEANKSWAKQVKVEQSENIKQIK